MLNRFSNQAYLKHWRGMTGDIETTIWAFQGQRGGFGSATPTLITTAYSHFPFLRLKYLSLFLEINFQRLLFGSVFITRCRNSSRIKFYSPEIQFYAFLVETVVIYLESKMKQLRGKSKPRFLLSFSFVLQCLSIVFMKIILKNGSQ